MSVSERSIEDLWNTLFCDDKLNIIVHEQDIESGLKDDDPHVVSLVFFAEKKDIDNVKQRRLRREQVCHKPPEKQRGAYDDKKIESEKKRLVAARVMNDDGDDEDIERYLGGEQEPRHS